MTAREFARRKVADRLKRTPHIDPDDWFHFAGGSSPAFGDEPRHCWNGSGFPYQRPDGSLATVPRGKLYVAVGGSCSEPEDHELFSIRELVREARSGHAQASLF